MARSIGRDIFPFYIRVTSPKIRQIWDSLAGER
jgi:hypothetical protein